MIEYNWNISRLECKPHEGDYQDYVVTAHWQCNGSDGQYSGSVYSTSSFPIAQGESFTPYGELTQEQVLGWIWTNGVDKDAAEAAVAQQIENQINPPIVSPPLPWVVSP